jgi:hypothetical protein
MSSKLNPGKANIQIYSKWEANQLRDGKQCENMAALVIKHKCDVPPLFILGKSPSPIPPQSPNLKSIGSAV